MQSKTFQRIQILVAVLLVGTIIFLFLQVQQKQIDDRGAVEYTVVKHLTGAKPSRQRLCTNILASASSPSGGARSAYGGKPPRQPPSELKNAYLLNGHAQLRDYYIGHEYALSPNLKFSRQQMDELIAKAKAGGSNHYGPILDDQVHAAMRGWQPLIQGKHVVVLGTLVPFYEAMAIAYGAASVTTIEYNKLVIDHPMIKTLTVQEYLALPFEQKPTFDVAISISSFEHDGLGRYGDPLDPWGDLKAMLRVRCMLKPHGILFWAACVGQDSVYWNAHRFYGKHRIPLAFRGYTVLASYGLKASTLEQQQEVIQPIIVAANDPFDFESQEMYGAPDLVQHYINDNCQPSYEWCRCCRSRCLKKKE